MKTRINPNTQKCRHGYASLLTVLAIGFFLLLTLTSIYKTTVESQLTVRNNTLRGDYQQREEAFLNAVLTRTPQFAVRCMQDDSDNSAVRLTIQWHDIFDLALVDSNANSAIDDTTLSDLGFQPNVLINGHTADVISTSGTLNAETITDPVPATGGIILSFRHTTHGVGRTASVSYPAPLESNNTFLHRGRGSNFPSLSPLINYGASADGWVGADVNAYPQYNIVPSPSSRFNYNNSDTIIAKHNWWAFTLDFSKENKNLTGLTNTEKSYIISIYEIPSQLAISANSAATLGAHSDGSEWNSNINIKGAVFAEDLTTTGNFSADALTSRKGVTMSAGTSINGTSLTGASTGLNPMASNDRELAESTETTFPIYSSGDGGKVAFIPVHRDISFYDRFAGKASIAEADAVTPTGNNSVARSSWDYYSNGARQCAMHLDIIDVVSATDQTATKLQFTYSSNNISRTIIIPDDIAWPSPTSPAGLLFPFHAIQSNTGTPQLAVYLNRLDPFLKSLPSPGDDQDINHSLSINADYTNSTFTGIQNPTDNYDTANAILLDEAQDLSPYTKGFSLVTNMRLIIPESINTSPATTLPPGFTPDPGETFYPPTSIFAPQKRYGTRLEVASIEVNGQVNSIGTTSASTTNPLDFKSGTSEILNTSSVTANLTSLKHPGQLPPINLINWMITIRPL